MTDSIVPDWIRRIEAENDQKATADRAAGAATGNTIESGGPAYWRQLLNEFQVTVEHLKAIGMSGSVSMFPPSGAYETVEISITWFSGYARQVSIQLGYRPGGAEILRHPSSWYGGPLKLCMVNGRVALLANGALNPQKAVRFIIEKMVEDLRKK